MSSPIEIAAVKALNRLYGARVAGRVFLHLRRREKDGEPFGHLPAARSLAETRSRALVGAAVRLFRELDETVEVDDPLAITDEAVDAGVVVFLNRTVGAIRRPDWADVDQDTRLEWVSERSVGFPGAEIRWDHVSADSIGFTVTSCRFVQLCAVAEEPQLARLFCRADARFLGQNEPHMMLIREHTIAAGADDCPFELKFT